jgi:hypothetical protein
VRLWPGNDFRINPSDAVKSLVGYHSAEFDPKKGSADVKKSSKTPGEVVLLSGGNPQIGKGDGEEPVEAYLDAMPGWKQTVGRKLDALIVSAIPGVKKAVRWNTPFYGLEGEGWFVAFHCITKYVKVSFFRGSSLTPVPPVASKQAEVRYVHIHEDDEIDEALLMDWFRQAASLPGEKCF